MIYFILAMIIFYLIFTDDNDNNDEDMNEGLMPIL